MRVTALNAACRPGKTTTQLARQALDGAASVGAEAEMVMLMDHDIRFCTNCLTCYKDLGAAIAPCSVKDDVRGILEKIRESDGIVLVSPVHSGFVTGLMTTFIERATWTLCRPTGELLGMQGVPEPRLTDRVRGSVTIVGAGAMPTELRQYCDMGTPWMADMAQLLFNGEVVGDMYAGASFSKELTGDEWSKAYQFRQLSEQQLAEAFGLGAKLAEALKNGEVRPYDPERIAAALAPPDGPGGPE
ncbi:flavodoxin family protein [Thermodesulfobacteriota bacterium]